METVLTLDPRQTMILAILVLFLGRFLNRNLAFCQKYNIPEPVSGGIMVSLVLSLLYAFFQLSVDFSLHQRDILLVVFFTGIGLSAKFANLLSGGKTLLILLLLAIGYLFLQNITGITLAQSTGLASELGVLTGSVSLSGGHGTAIAWAPTFIEQYGISNAGEIGVACATFGLVLGGIAGGPIASFLIRRHKLTPEQKAQVSVGVVNESRQKVTVDAIFSCLLTLAVAIGIGIHLHQLLAALGINLPAFVPCIFGGILLTNTLPLLFPKLPWPTGTPTLALVSEVSLGLFLAMSLMSLQLWTLIDLALPVLLILAAQVLVVTLFSILLVFRLLGKNYDAAVIASGYAGLALGATPTAIANMTAVTKKYGASPLAFVVVPLVGAFFIDISNAVIIQRMLSLLA